MYEAVNVDRFLNEGDVTTWDSAFCAMDLALRARKAAGKVETTGFSFMIDKARHHLAEAMEAAKVQGSNVPDVEKLAAATFRHEAETAWMESVRRHGFTEESQKNTKRYISELTSALLEGCPLLDRKDSGEYVIGGRSALGKWRKAEKERREEEELNEARKMAGLEVVDSESETGDGQTEGLLASIENDAIREKVVEYIETIAKIVEVGGTAEAHELLDKALKPSRHFVSRELNRIQQAAKAAVNA